MVHPMIQNYSLLQQENTIEITMKKKIFYRKRVKKIIIPERFKGLMTSFTADIALVILDKALEITRAVQPVCIDWNNEYEATQLRDHNKGLVVGWGYTNAGQDPSAELKQLSVPYINFTQCYKSVPNSFTRFLTNDKFCAGFANGSSVCHGDSGGGLVFKKEDTKKYYLRGLVSVGPLEEDKCDSRQYVAYTKVSDYMLMLRDVEVNSRLPVIPLTLPDGSCALPPQPANGRYTTNQSLTILTYSCSPGYQLYPSTNNNVAICDSGKWHPNLSECVRTCAPRISDSVDTYCEHKGIKVNCSKPMIEGTTVRMNCKHLFSQVDSPENSVSVCTDGSWNYAFIKCVPECGNVVPEGGVFIIGGNNVKKGKFPWHVGIYKLNSTKQFEQKCGGTIISSKVIISVAHCFSSYADGEPYDVKQYAIGAGKYYRNYYNERDTLSQTSTIKEIIIPPQYKGLLTNFIGNIAFLTLDKALEITHVVQPVCIDWNQQYEAAQLKDNNIGRFVGWGYTKEGEDQDTSDELQELSAPFVNFVTCLESVPESFLRFMTNDKFCAGFANGSSVCYGDSGGGLVFLWPDNKKYYLRGLVNFGPLKQGKCDSRQYAAYTRVSDYMETLRAVVANTTV